MEVLMMAETDPANSLGMGMVDQNAVQVDELMQSYLRVGFTREEAFELVKMHLHAVLFANVLPFNR